MKLVPAEICKVLSVETRLKIIKLLKTKGSLGAKEIAESLGVTTAAISQHLKILSQVGMVSSERKGFYIPYTINEDVLKQCRQLLSDVCLCSCSDSAELFEAEIQTLTVEALRKLATDLEDKLKTVKDRLYFLEGE